MMYFDRGQGPGSVTVGANEHSHFGLISEPLHNEPGVRSWGTVLEFDFDSVSSLSQTNIILEIIKSLKAKELNQS